MHCKGNVPGAESTPRVHSSRDPCSGTLLAHRPAGFLFPRLPILQGDPADEEVTPAVVSDSGGDGHSIMSEEHKMTCSQFVLVTFFIVAGGPTGVETVVSSGGPLYAFIGLLIIPWLWSTPTYFFHLVFSVFVSRCHPPRLSPLFQVSTYCTRFC